MKIKEKIGLAAAALLLTAAAEPEGAVADLGWIAGTWVSETGDDWVEERWSDARGGVILGTNRSGTGAEATGFEFMRIAAEKDGSVHFWGSPGGAPAVAFRLVSSGDGEAVFENPAHDYPTRIVYRREGAELRASVSGPDGERTLSWTFRRRDGCC